MRDALAVLDTVADGPIPFVGHSKGGGIMLQLAESCPHRISHLVVIDGLPSPMPHPDIADHERTRLLTATSAGGSTTAGASQAPSASRTRSTVSPSGAAV